MLRSTLQHHCHRFPILRQSSSSSSTSKTNVTTIRLYRILLRQLQALPAGETPFLLQPPLNPRDYGRARLMSSMVVENKDKDLFKLFCRWHEDDDDEEGVLHTWYRDLVGSDLKDEEEQLDDIDLDSCLWTSRKAILSAMRTAFMTSSKSSTLATTPIPQQQKFAILAISALQDVELTQQRTSVSMEDGLRVVATSSCIGTAATGSALIHETKHRFAYRIRVENLPDNDKTVQLVGRTWRIQEENHFNVPHGDPIIVQAPTTGAVGHLPVLQPGQVFEYMSGCELGTKTGNMSGLLHMAVVPPKTTSAMVGDPIDAFQSDHKFELAVQPFPLIAEEKGEA